ncbi:MAG: nitrite/sulfite reductase [bacterium]|nr:nitrite/sulfite reductase [bacterium]
MRDYLQEFLPDLDEFREKTMKFYDGEMSVAEYKGFSGGFGSYAQRGGQKHMLRLRMAGGRLTKERLKFIVEAQKKYGIDTIKITTCQSIQLHNLEAADLCELIEQAWKAGMISRGGGGDFPRNVMASPLSGVQQDEYFDVMPYAIEMGEYLMQFIKARKFPRKLKVCFSNGPKNEPHATFRDLGFVAREDGKFDVYIAGGLGNKPALGVKVAEAVEPTRILYYAKAMVETFIAHGNYENRGRARTRFMQDTLGVDGLKEAYLGKLQEALDSENLDIEITPVAVDKRTTKDLLSDRRVVAQKQDGLYAVFYQPIGGFLPVDKLAEIYDAVKDMEAVELRLTPEEGLYFINCNSMEAQKLLALTEDGAANLFETSVACVGCTICQVGVGDSSGMLMKCVERVRKENFADGVLPQIHISGCPSSCSAHQIGAIGFRGAVKQTADGPKPAFAIGIGGTPLQGEEKLAEVGKAITVEEIPEFLVELGKLVSDAKTTYDKWSKTHEEELLALVEKYTA